MKYQQSPSNAANTPRLTTLVSLMTACALLSACGGGGGGGSEGADKSIAAITPSGETSASASAAQAASEPAEAASDAASAPTEAASGPTATALAAAEKLVATNPIATPVPAPAPGAAPTAASATTTATAAASAAKAPTPSAPPAAAAPATQLATKVTTAPVPVAVPAPAPTPATTTGSAATKVTAPSPIAVIALPPAPAAAPAPPVAPIVIAPDALATKGDAVAAAAPAFLTLNGLGISSAYATGCSPSIKADFIDSGTWTTRRLEPRDCAIVPTSTPIFSWRQPSTRDTKVAWTFTLRKANGDLVLTRQTASPRLLLADQSLATGLYTWTVSFTDAKKQVFTSDPRRFAVPDGASKAQLPAGATLAAAAAAKARPRLIPTGSTPTKVAAAARASELNGSFSAFLAAADTALASQASAAPTAAPKSAQSASDAAMLTAIKKQTEAEHAAIESLGYGFVFTGDTKYQKAGIERVMALAGWSTTGPTSEAIQDQANRQIYLALAKGLDFFAAGLTSQQTAIIVATLKDRIQQARADVATLDSNPYNSHVLTATQFITESLLYAVGTPGFPEAKAWLAEAWEVWLTGTIGAWGGGSDGAYGNGEAYGWYTLSSFANTVAAVRLIGNADLSNWAPVSKFGDNQIAFTSPFSTARSAFGDDSERTGHYWDYGRDGYRLYASLTRAPVHEWYWRQNAASVAYKMAIAPANYMMLGLYPNRPLSAAPMANSSLFEDAGLVAIHSKTTDPARSSVFFRSSRLGSFNHSHADNNSFNFTSKGLPLLISGGYYPYYDSPHHAGVARASRFKNALTFDGGIGQAEPSATPSSPGKPVYSMDARGQLLNFADSGKWATATGDATLAYRGLNTSNQAWNPLVTNAVRSIAYNRTDKVLVIYDWATSASNRSWELNFQTLNPPTIQGNTSKISNATASACIDVYGLPGAVATVSSGFPIAPEASFPTQHRVRYSAGIPSQALASVTVVREDCKALPVSVSFNGTAAKVTINGGTEVVFDQRTVKLPVQ